MTEPRLAASVIIKALQRVVFDHGGFAAVLHKGDEIAGAILLQCAENGGELRLMERMPLLEGGYEWQVIREDLVNKAPELNDYLTKRIAMDPDIWVLELDIAGVERFIAQIGT